MTAVQSAAAKRRYQRESQVICPQCDGTGRVVRDQIRARAKRGGHFSYLKSLLPGHESMAQRGKKGGRPRDPTLSEAEASAGSRDSGQS